MKTTMITAEWLVALVLASSARAAVVFAAAAVVALALRRGPAAWRHLAWSVAVAGSLCLPALSTILPGWRLALPAPSGRSEIAAPAARDAEKQIDSYAMMPAPAVGMDRAGLPTLSTGQPAGGVPRSSGPLTHAEGPLAVELFAFQFVKIGPWVLAVWVAGVLLAAVPVVLGWLSLRAVARRSRAVGDPARLKLARDLAARVGVKRPVRLVVSDQREIPMTWGVRRAVVLLPAESERWQDERLASALLHELAHVKRCDCLTQLLARAACAVYWFNPLAWLALARIRSEQEQAADDLALESGLDRHAYAHHLLAIVTGRSASKSCAAVAMASSSRLERRLRGILDAGRSRRGLGLRPVAAAVAIAWAVLVPLAAFHPLTGAEPEPPAAEKPAAVPVELEVLKRVRDLHVAAPAESTLRDGAIKGILEVLHDPYSTYFDACALADLERSIAGKLTGIGAELNLNENGQVTVVRLVPGSPALKAGLKPDDVIEAVDGKPTRGLPLAEVVGRIIGKAGESVRITVKHSHDRGEELEIVRAELTMRSVLGFRGADERYDFVLDREHGLGYVRIMYFGDHTAAELKEALGRLQARGMKGLIVDLRGCPGGLMSAAVDVVKLFVAKGTIVTVRNRDGVAVPTTATGPALVPELPMVVVVDGTTASAGEIVAGALKDNDRAVLVGTRTFGKGSVQTLIKLKENRGAIRLTSAYYRLPHGEDIDRREGKPDWGVDPTDGDYVPVDAATQEAMARSRRQRERGEADEAAGNNATPEAIARSESDPQLAAALRTLIARTTAGAFEKVGLPLTEQTARIHRRDEAQKRRQALLDDLKKVDQELGALGGDHGGGR